MAVKKKTHTANSEPLEAKLRDAYHRGRVDEANSQARSPVRHRMDEIWDQLGHPETFAVSRNPDGSTSLTAAWKN